MRGKGWSCGGSYLLESSYRFHNTCSFKLFRYFERFSHKSTAFRSRDIPKLLTPNQIGDVDIFKWAVIPLLCKHSSKNCVLHIRCSLINFFVYAVRFALFVHALFICPLSSSAVMHLPVFDNPEVCAICWPIADEQYGVVQLCIGACWVTVDARAIQLEWPTARIHSHR